MVRRIRRRRRKIYRGKGNAKAVDKNDGKYEICFYLDGVATSRARSDDIAAFAEAVAFFGKFLKSRFSYTITTTV